MLTTEQALDVIGDIARQLEDTAWLNNRGPVWASDLGLAVEALEKHINDDLVARCEKTLINHEEEEVA